MATDEPTTEPTDTPQATDEPTGEPTAEPTESPSCGVSAPCGSIIPGVEDQEIVIGEPVLFPDPDFPQAGLLVQNVSDLVKSYSLLGTFKNGDTITGTATGYVSDHLPGTVRTPTLFVDGSPGASDVLTVAIDTMLLEEPSSDGGDVAMLVTFGPPTFDLESFIPAIVVEVTNRSDQTASITVNAGILRDGVLVGIASGYLSDMAPGQVKTAQMYITGDAAETDQLLFSVDNVLISE